MPRIVYREIWWQNDDLSNIVSEKHKLWTEQKQGNTNKEKYHRAKKKARKAVYQAIYLARRKLFADFSWKCNHKIEVFMITKLKHL